MLYGQKYLNFLYQLHFNWHEHQSCADVLNIWIKMFLCCITPDRSLDKLLDRVYTHVFVLTVSWVARTVVS